MNTKLTILLMAYDSYSDVWDGFVKCKKKYWPDCPFETVMINCNVSMEQLDLNIRNAINRVISIGERTEWTERLHKALEQVDTPYVFLWLEDLYVDRKMNNSLVERYVELMDEHEDVGYIRLCRDMDYQIECDLDSSLGEILPNHAYRVSTHPSIWRKEYLYALTEKYMDAWNFEYQVGFECDKYGLRSFITKEDVLHFTNMVWRAKWTKEAVKLDKRDGLGIDYSNRKKHSIWSNIKTDINTLIFKVLGPDLVTKMIMKRRAMGKGIPKA